MTASTILRSCGPEQRARLYARLPLLATVTVGVCVCVWCPGDVTCCGLICSQLLSLFHPPSSYHCTVCFHFVWSILWDVRNVRKLRYVSKSESGFIFIVTLFQRWFGGCFLWQWRHHTHTQLHKPPLVDLCPNVSLTSSRLHGPQAAAGSCAEVRKEPEGVELISVHSREWEEEKTAPGERPSENLRSYVSPFLNETSTFSVTAGFSLDLQLLPFIQLKAETLFSVNNIDFAL